SNYYGERESCAYGDPGRLLVVDDQLCRDDTEKCHACTYGKIDARNENDESHPHTHDDDLGNLGRDVAQVARREKCIARAGVKGKQNPEQEQDSACPNDPGMREFGEERFSPELAMAKLLAHLVN